jgi:hypothetical protein
LLACADDQHHQRERHAFRRVRILNQIAPCTLSAGAALWRSIRYLILNSGKLQRIAKHDLTAAPGRSRHAGLAHGRRLGVARVCCSNYRSYRGVLSVRADRKKCTFTKVPGLGPDSALMETSIAGVFMPRNMACEKDPSTTTKCHNRGEYNARSRCSARSLSAAYHEVARPQDGRASRYCSLLALPPF